MLRKFLYVLLVGLMAGCGGGGDSGSGTITPPPATGTGTIVGKASDNATGAVISGAAVTDGTVSTTTGADGTYTLASATASNKVITFTKSGYIYGSKIINVVAATTVRADIAMLPIGRSTTITSQAAAQTIPGPAGSPAQVILPVNALVTAAGGTPSGNITANVTPIDPSSNPQIMPGNYTTSAGGTMESFGAVEINFRDAAGSNLNLASGKTATIRIPLAAAATNPAATMPAFWYNSSTGLWVEEGILTLGGTAPNQYYEGTVSHFSYWNADYAYASTCLTGKVLKADGTPQPYAKVEAQGRGYVGTSTVWTASDGTFTIRVKPNSTVIITASTSGGLSQSLVVSTGAAGTTCSPLSANLVLGGTSTSGSAKITLTWGANPSDLDSHLTGPLTATGSNSTTGTRFHVYYGNLGSLTGSSFAALDVDDVTSFGPEVVTINRFVTGTYRYSVHHFSGSSNIFTSPARVELQLNGQTSIYTPPNPGTTAIGDDSVWVVFELVVSSTGTVTVVPKNTYQLNASAGSIQKPDPGSFDEFFLFRNLPKK